MQTIANNFCGVRGKKVPRSREQRRKPSPGCCPAVTGGAYLRPLHCFTSKNPTEPQGRQHSAQLTGIEVPSADTRERAVPFLYDHHYPNTECSVRAAPSFPLPRAGESVCVGLRVCSRTRAFQAALSASAVEIRAPWKQGQTWFCSHVEHHPLN